MLTFFSKCCSCLGLPSLRWVIWTGSQANKFLTSNCWFFEWIQHEAVEDVNNVRKYAWSIPGRDFSLCPMLVATFTKLQIYHHLFNTQMHCTGFVLPNILHSYHNLGWGLSSINWYASGMPTFSSRSPASRKDCRKKKPCCSRKQQK